MTVKMQKGDLFADIFDSPETIAQARREGYSLADPEDIAKRADDLEQLTKVELIELARERNVYEKGLEQRKKADIIAILQAAKPDEKTDPEKELDTPARDELIQAAIAKGFEEDHLNSLSDEELTALLETKE
jgi:hypothetical protein